MASSKYEKIVLAFSKDADNDNECKGTLFEVLNEKEDQYYKLVLKDRDSLVFDFKLQSTLDARTVNIDPGHIDFCDTTRHIVNIERTAEGNIKYRVDGRKVVEKKFESSSDTLPMFVKPYNYYIGNTKAKDDSFDGCISGAKFHLFTFDGVMKTVEPIAQGIRNSNTSCKLAFSYISTTVQSLWINSRLLYISLTKGLKVKSA